MRIGTALMKQLRIGAMVEQQARLAKTQVQIASGQRILKPSDDPTGAVRSLDLTEALETNRRYQTTIQVGRNRLEFEDSVLEGATNILQRARELAVQSLNDTLTAQDRRAIGKEVEQLRDEMLGLSNTRNANGEYIFSGYRSTTPAYRFDSTGVPPGYVYQGDDSQRQLQVGAIHSIADGDPGSAVFGPSGSSVLDTLNTFANALAGVGTFAPTVNTALTDIDAALQRIDDIRAGVGGRLNALELQENMNEKFIEDIQTNLSETRDLDLAEAIGRLNLQQVALQAAQQAYAKVQGLSLFNYL